MDGVMQRCDETGVAQEISNKVCAIAGVCADQQQALPQADNHHSTTGAGEWSAAPASVEVEAGLAAALSVTREGVKGGAFGLSARPNDSVHAAGGGSLQQGEVGQGGAKAPLDHTSTPQAVHASKGARVSLSSSTTSHTAPTDCVSITTPTTNNNSPSNPPIAPLKQPTRSTQEQPSTQSQAPHHNTQTRACAPPHITPITTRGPSQKETRPEGPVVGLSSLTPASLSSLSPEVAEERGGGSPTGSCVSGGGWLLPLSPFQMGVVHSNDSSEAPLPLLNSQVR